MRRPVLVLLVVAACGGPPAPAAPGGASPAPVAAFDDDDAFAATVMPQVLDTGGGTIRALVVSPDGARLAALKSGSVQVWAVGGDGRLTALGDAVEYRHDDAEGACITASSRTLATSADGAVHVYDLDGAPRERARWDLPEDVLGFGLPDDDHLVVVTRLAVVALAIGPDGGVTITHEEALPARAFDAALSCDGRWLDVKPAGVDRRDLYAVDPGTGAVHAATAADVPAAGATDAADAVRVGDAQWTIAAAGVTRLAPPWRWAAARRGDRFARGAADGLIELRDGAVAQLDDAPTRAQHVEQGVLYDRITRPAVTAVAIDPDGRWAFAGGYTGTVRVVPATAAAPRTVTIGGDRVRWEPSSRPPAGAWPVLTTTTTIDAVADDEVAARVHVTNTGDVAAAEVVVTLEAERDRRGADRYRVHVGTVAPGETVTRRITVPLPRDGRPTQVARLATYTAGAHGAAGPTTLDVVLPRLADDAAAFDALARRIFDVARDEVRAMIETVAGADAAASFHPELARLEPDQIGFFAIGDTVWYQNLPEMAPEARAVNRAIVAARTDDELARHGEMMLLWYLPHELIHEARHHLDVAGETWTEEYIANVMAPRVLERVLARLPDLGYSLASFDWIVAQYVRRLQPMVSDRDADVVDTIIASGGAHGSLDYSPIQAITQQPWTYVWFGARVHQHGRAVGDELDTLRDRYLRAAPAPAPAR